MSAVHQATLPLPRPGLPRVRACRRPFTPSPSAGPYRLPAAVLDRLTATLAPFRNRDAAFALAMFLGRFWSAPKRLGLPFPIDRRALTDHVALDLSEARVRGAIATLEAVGFLDRADDRRRYQATEGGLHRRPILFSFGLEALRGFEAANRRAFARAQAVAGSRRAPAGTKDTAQVPPSSCDPRPAQRLSSPKNTFPPEAVFLMGDQQKGSPGRRPASPIEPGSALENALARLAAGVIGTGRA